MGEGKFQKFIFTLFMCFFMVLGMTFYNILLLEGWSGEILILMIRQIGLVFIVALTLDTLVVGPLAKTLAFKIIPPGEEKMLIFRILSIALPMVFGMVLFMSIFGALMGFGWSMDALHHYPSIVLKNLIVALPLNLLIVSPLVRTIFPLFFSPSKAAA